MKINVFLQCTFYWLCLFALLFNFTASVFFKGRKSLYKIDGPLYWLTTDSDETSVMKRKKSNLLATDSWPLINFCRSASFFKSREKIIGNVPRGCDLLWQSTFFGCLYSQWYLFSSQPWKSFLLCLIREGHEYLEFLANFMNLKKKKFKTLSVQ